MVFLQGLSPTSYRYIKTFLDAPTFKKKPQDHSDDPGKKYTLDCEADGNPAPTYAWFRNGNENQMLHDASSYTITLGDDTVGLYECRVTVKGYKEIRAQATVYQYGPPRVLSSSSGTVSVRRGADAVLTCDTFAVPVPDNDVVWRYREMIISANDQYSINNVKKEDGSVKVGVVSTLTVRDVGEPDFGDYVCSVDNGHGENSHNVHLQRIGMVQQMSNL